MHPTVWEKIRAFIEKEWTGIEHWGEAEWQDLVVAFKPFATQLTAGQYTILKGLAQAALADLGSGDIAGVVQDVLMRAETQELHWVLTLGEDFLSAVVAVTAANASAATTPTS